MNHQQHRFQGRPSGERAGRMRATPGLEDRDMLSVLSGAARDNPVSAALIGLGALWLFMGGNKTSLIGGRGRKSLIGSVAHGAGSVAHGAAAAAGTAASAVTSGVSGIAGGMGDAVERVGEYVSGSLKGADVEAAYRNPSFQDDVAAAEDWEPSGHASSTSLIRQNLRDLFERHPVALGVAGLALGAGIAASFPVTETERDTLGEAGKAVRHRLSAAADQAKDLASAVADEVRQQGVPNPGN